MQGRLDRGTSDIANSLREINLPVELAKLKSRGWIKSLRESDTGIGKTIEEMLGVKENNLGQPDCRYEGNFVELKCHRLHSNSMITLFTLEPGVRNLNDVQLMKKYGYKDSNGRQALKITLTTERFTPQHLKLVSEVEKKQIAIVDEEGNKPWTWTTTDIRLKLNNLCVIYADSKKEKGKEYFRVERSILAIGLDEKCLFRMIEQGLIKIDLRMHMKPNETSRNHGTAFRLTRWTDIIDCYKEQRTLL